MSVSIFFPYLTGLSKVTFYNLPAGTPAPINPVFGHYLFDCGDINNLSFPKKLKRLITYIFSAFRTKTSTMFNNLIRGICHLQCFPPALRFPFSRRLLVRGDLFSRACILTMSFNFSMIILSDVFITCATKLILKSNISKNVIAYLSNTKIIIVNMCSFLKNVIIMKTENVNFEKQTVNNTLFLNFKYSKL